MRNRRSIEIKFSIIALSFAVLCYIIHFVFFRYSFPPVNLDEASFFSPAYSFATKGTLSSDIHKSFLQGGDRYTYWMPPFYMVLLGAVLKLIGSTVLNAKLLSFFFISLSALLITKISNDKYVKISVCSLLLICPFIIITSAFIRMEALAILLITISILAVKASANEYILGLLSGVLILTHPMLMPCSAALGIVMIRRGMKPFLMFSLITFLILVPYLMYIFQDLELYRMQMALQFERKSRAKIADLKFSYLIQSIPISVAAIFCLFKLKSFQELKLFLLLGIILTLGLALKSNEFNYQVYLIPYIIATVGLILSDKKEVKIFRYGLPVTLFIFFSLLLFSKAKKYNFISDNSYRNMLSYLERNRSWKGKSIYVEGNPDISTFLIMHGQNVERQNAVASAKGINWYQAYNYVITVDENYERDDKSKKSVIIDTLRQKPWLLWPTKSSYTTPNNLHTLNVFIKK